MALRGSVAAVVVLVAGACSTAAKSPEPTLTPDGSTELALFAERAAHTATRSGGEALIVGGCVTDGCSEATSSVVSVAAEGTVTIRPRLLFPRSGHVAAALADGSVLVVGGFSGEGEPPLATAETLGPQADAWQPTGPLRVGRGGHAVGVLGDGRVVVAGGWVGSQTFTASTEIYDPTTRRFVRGPDLPRAVDGLAAASLPDGSVLIAGGQMRPEVATGAAALIEPDGTLRRVGPLRQPRFKHAMVALPTGEVLVIGGTDDDQRLLRSTEVFNPRTGTFRAGPSLASGRYKLSGAAAALPDDRVIVAGGGPEVEVIDLDAGTSRTIQTGATDQVWASFSTVSVLPDRVLVLGGYDQRINLTGLHELLPIDQL
jgi:hypothetical protein